MMGREGQGSTVQRVMWVMGQLHDGLHGSWVNHVMGHVGHGGSRGLYWKVTKDGPRLTL